MRMFLLGFMVSSFLIVSCGGGDGRSNSDLLSDKDEIIDTVIDEDTETLDEDIFKCTDGEIKVVICITSSAKFQKQKCNALGEWEDDGACYEQPVMGSMFSIPENVFWQGCRTDENGNTAEICEDDTKPYHKVSVASFKMDVYEVTNIQYVDFLNANGNSCLANDCVDSEESSHLQLYESDGVWHVKGGFAHNPIVKVTWYGAKAYCKWMGKRLPSESEWELAARGTDERLYPWGNETATCEYAVMDDGGSGCETSEPYYWAVVLKSSGISPYGLFHMVGNVWEWVEDDWHIDYNVEGRPDDGAAWATSPREWERVLRGGSWNETKGSLHVALRSRAYPEKSYDNVGFRCAAK